MPTKQEVRCAAVHDSIRRHGVARNDLFLADAMDPTHPCHDDFDWNDKTCAHSARLDRAYQIIKSVKFVVEVARANETLMQVTPVQVGVRAFVPSFYEVKSFLPRDRVLGAAESRRQFIQAKLRELEGWARSVSDIEELADLRDDIAQEIAQVRENLEPSVAATG